MPSARRFVYFETPSKECQRQPRQYDQSQQVKTSTNASIIGCWVIML